MSAVVCGHSREEAREEQKRRRERVPSPRGLRRIRLCDDSLFEEAIFKFFLMGSRGRSRLLDTNFLNGGLSDSLRSSAFLDTRLNSKYTLLCRYQLTCSVKIATFCKENKENWSQK